ncbi:MAG TPA: hypothetical protein VGN63_12310 [Flavisolibacter sp.]|jgi:hypothetical protein|nr:hypothetical protein [Flavisolibacter sp.]
METFLLWHKFFATNAGAGKRQPHNSLNIEKVVAEKVCSNVKLAGCRILQEP